MKKHKYRQFKTPKATHMSSLQFSRNPLLFHFNISSRDREPFPENLKSPNRIRLTKNLNFFDLYSTFLEYCKCFLLI